MEPSSIHLTQGTDGYYDLKLEGVQDLPNMCVEIGKKLLEQPVSSSSPSLENYKFIPFQSPQKRTICELFSKNAEKLLKDKGWHIRAFDGFSGIRGAKGEIIYGVALQKPKGAEFASASDHEQAYEQVLDGLMKGWSLLKDPIDTPPNIFEFDPSEHVLFVKKAYLDKESMLIRLLCDEFQIGYKVNVTEPDAQGNIYIRVDKSVFPTFRGKFFPSIDKLL